MVRLSRNNERLDAREARVNNRIHFKHERDARLLGSNGFQRSSNDGAKNARGGDNFSILSSAPSPSRRVEGATEGGEKKVVGRERAVRRSGAKLKHWRGKLSAERGARGSDKVAIAYTTDSEPGSVILIKTVVRKKRRAGSAFAWKIMLGTRINITLYRSLPTIDTDGRDYTRFNTSRISIRRTWCFFS